MKQSWAIVLGVLALLVGIGGVYYGVSATKKLIELEDRCTTIEQNLSQVSAKANEVDKVDAGLTALKTQIETELGAIDARLQAVDQKFADMATKSSGKGKEGGKAKSEKMAKPADGIYVAEQGDTIEKIARKFGVNKWKITDANPKLEIDKITAGTRIKIP